MANQSYHIWLRSNKHEHEYGMRWDDVLIELPNEIVRIAHFNPIPTSISLMKLVRASVPFTLWIYSKIFIVQITDTFPYSLISIDPEIVIADWQNWAFDGMALKSIDCLVIASGSSIEKWLSFYTQQIYIWAVCYVIASNGIIVYGLFSFQLRCLSHHTKLKQSSWFAIWLPLIHKLSKLAIANYLQNFTDLLAICRCTAWNEWANNNTNSNHNIDGSINTTSILWALKRRRERERELQHSEREYEKLHAITVKSGRFLAIFSSQFLFRIYLNLIWF